MGERVNWLLPLQGYVLLPHEGRVTDGFQALVSFNFFTILLCTIVAYCTCWYQSGHRTNVYFRPNNVHISFVQK